MPRDWYTPRSLFNFRWRASRREYFLIQALGLLALLLSLLPGALFTTAFDRGGGEPGPVGVALILAFAALQFGILIAGFVALLAVSVRRMHD